jgi:uncharacterized metal-binding protein YceD (DUF177 family)
MSKPERPWNVPVALHDIPETGRRFDLTADAATRNAVGRLAGLRDLPALSASFEVTRYGPQGLHVSGTVSARVGQTCVVTLEPIENGMEETVDLVFVPPPARSALDATQGGADEKSEDDAPETLINGTVDLGAIATEFLLLGIDPYPRKSGAAFEPVTAGAVDADHPFAALAGLKKPKPGSDR